MVCDSGPRGSSRIRQRLFEQRRDGEHYQGEGCQDDEDAPPSPMVGGDATDDWRRRGGDAVDSADERHELREVAAAVEVGGDGAGEKVASGGADAHENAANVEKVDSGREERDDGGDDEQGYGPDEHGFAAYAVAERPEDQLAERQSDHAHRESHLGERGVAAEEAAHGRQGWRIHVVDERPQRAQHYEVEDQEGEVFPAVGPGRGRRARYRVG